MPIENENSTTETVTENSTENVFLANIPLVPASASEHLPAQTDDTPATPQASKPASRRVVRIGKSGGSKSKSVKPKTSAPAKIAQAASPASTKSAASEAELNERATARLAAAKAVAAFYAGKSLPFKASVDLRRKSPINHALTRDPSARTAGLIAAILTYCDVQPDGSFVRGSGRVPGSLLGYTGDDAKRMHSAGAESGCLSNCMPDRIAYVSGATSGAGCENAVFMLNFAACEANLRAHNDLIDGQRVFAAPLRLLAAIQRKANAILADAPTPA